MLPVKIKINKDSEALLIKWDDESDSAIPLLKLRRLCPCATCLSQRESQGKNYIPIFNSNQLQIKQIKSVGSYAIGIIWGDGHSTGIYEFPFLHRLSENELNTGKT